MSSNPFIPTRSLRLSLCLLAAAFGTVAAIAGPGSKSTSASSFHYSFALNPNSVQYAQYLQVNDFGLTVYNLINQDGGTYGTQTGAGTESAQVLPSTYFDDSTWTGLSAVQMNSSESGPGTAASSAGGQEFLTLTNNGSKTIQINVTVTGTASATAAIFGSPTVNSATSQAYFGFQDAHIVDGEFVVVANPYCHETCTALQFPQLAIFGLWYPKTAQGVTSYSSTYVITITPGDTHYVDFYASGSDASATGSLARP